jgi:hypothetical protein
MSLSICDSKRRPNESCVSKNVTHKRRSCSKSANGKQRFTSCSERGGFVTPGRVRSRRISWLLSVYADIAIFLICSGVSRTRTEW